MTPVGFEPTISAGERPQTYALDRAVTGTGLNLAPTMIRSPDCPARSSVAIPTELPGPHLNYESQSQMYELKINEISLNFVYKTNT